MAKTYQQKAADSVGAAKDFWLGMTDYYMDVTDAWDVRTRATAHALIEGAAVTDDMKVLDAGAGHLRLTAAIRKLVPRAQFVAVDLTRDLLVKGAEETRLQVPMLQADLNHLPLGDETVDAIISARVFQYIPDPAAALRELRRVVKRGGRVAISLPNSLNLIKQLRYRGRLSAPKEVEGWFLDAGFTAVRAGSACFVPPPLGKSWSSRLVGVERIQKIPVLGQMGGNVVASGLRP